MTTLFPRAHQFNRLDERAQYAFAEEMIKLWQTVKSDIEAQAIANGLALPRKMSEGSTLAPTLTQFREIAKKHNFDAEPYLRTSEPKKSPKVNWV